LSAKLTQMPRPSNYDSQSSWSKKGAGFTVSRDLSKLGYRGVESCELSFDDFRAPASSLLGKEEGRRFPQMMAGLEIGRIQVAARAIDVARAAFDDALRYSQERYALGKPIWQHQSIGNYRLFAVRGEGVALR